MKLFEKMEKSEVGGKEVKRRKRSVEKASSRETAADSSECKDIKQDVDVALTSPVTDAKPSEVTTIETAEVKHDDVASSTVDVVDTKPIAKPCTDTDTVPVDSESVIIDSTAQDLPATDTEVQSPHAISKSSKEVKRRKRNEKGSSREAADDAALDVIATDTEVQSPGDNFRNSPLPNESPGKSVVHLSPTDTILLEEIHHEKPDASSTDVVDVKDEPKTVTVEAVQDEVQVPEEAPGIKPSELNTDSRCVEETISITDEPKPVKDQVEVEVSEKVPKPETPKTMHADMKEETISVTGEPKPVTQQGKVKVSENMPEPETGKTIQTDVKAKTVSTVKKSAVTLEVKPRAVRGSVEPQSTAKLKFGMYARRPLAARTWVKVDKHESESSNDSDDEDTGSESKTESETTAKPKRHSVKFFQYFVSYLFCCNIYWVRNMAYRRITSCVDMLLQMTDGATVMLDQSDGRPFHWTLCPIETGVGLIKYNSTRLFSTVCFFLVVTSR